MVQSGCEESNMDKAEKEILAQIEEIKKAISIMNLIPQKQGFRMRFAPFAMLRNRLRCGTRLRLRSANIFHRLKAPHLMTALQNSKS